MNNKTLWIFRETRSGSTWICNALEKKLNKPLSHYESNLSKYGVFDPSKFQNPDILYSTHRFQYLSELKTNDPYVIRTTRRNKPDQCLSVLYWKYFPISMKHNFDNNAELESPGVPPTFGYDNFILSLDNPVTVKKQDIINMMIHMKQRDVFWQKNVEDFKTAVIVYEDLVDQVHLPDLDITLSFNEEFNFESKMPEYKTRVFKNYEQIVDWVNKAAIDLNLTQY
tara:strand:+ start:445 stop:1119 length:675 start_codon:yes stop_codon:yes gene_type:complete